ncbi:MAG: PaaI family thioesterase [Lentisphaerae bacterium]|nr:PaaI family thioesterase [Lentisphaerota bacterium]
MADYGKIKEFLNRNDRFCVFNGIRLTEVGDGYAEAVLEITDNSLNGRNVVQGGAIMTLADFAFAGAVNGSGVTGVSLNCTTNFIRPGSGKSLRAVARKVSQGKKTAVYNVEVFNDDDKLVATMGITGFIIDDQPVVC